MPPHLDNIRDLCASCIHRLNSQIPSEANKSSSFRTWGEQGQSRDVMISPGSAVTTVVSCTCHSCTASLGSQPRAASGCMDVFRNMDLFCASERRIILLRLFFSPVRINALLCLKRLSALLMSAFGKAVNNRSRFFGGKTQCPPSLLCCTRQTVPLAVQSLSSVSTSTVTRYIPLDLGPGLACRPCGSHSMACVQLVISVGHLLWPPDDAEASSW